MSKHEKSWTTERQFEDEIKAGKAEVYHGKHADKSIPARMDTKTFLDWASGSLARTQAFYARP